MSAPARPYWARASAPTPEAVQDYIASRVPARRVTFAMRRAAVAVLTDRGWSCAEIGRRLGMTPRTVTRYRATLPEAAGRPQ